MVILEQKQYLNIHDDVISDALEGDQVAYGKLYSLYSKAMFNIAYRIINDEDDAADILQESFLNAFKNLSKYRADASFGAWLKRIVVNRSINFLRKSKMEKVPVNDWEDLEKEMDSEDSFENLLTDDELILDLELIRDSIQMLPEGYRVIFSLYLLEGYDHQEISEIMGISVSTSKSQYNRAKKKLKDLISDKLISRN